MESERQRNRRLKDISDKEISDKDTARFVAILKTLPVRDDRKTWIENEAVALRWRISLAAMAHNPRSARRSGKQAALKEMDGVIIASIRLANAVNDLGPESQLALYQAATSASKRTLAPNEFLVALIRFGNAAKAGHGSIEASPRTTGDKGRPRSKLANEITEHAADAYTALTGLKPTITNRELDGQQVQTGKFTKFLRELFSAIGLNASPRFSP